MSSKIIFSKSFFINLIILLIPINFILGNLLLNLNVIILITLALFFYGLDIFKIKFDNIDRLILIFFLYLFINGIVNNYLVREDDFIQDTILIKTLAYSRYLLLYFVVRFLVIRKIINFKYLFFFYGFAALFVSVDIIIQYIFGVDLFGYKAKQTELGVERRLSGPFGDEYVAGSYIQRFFIFFPYFLIIFSKFKNINFYRFILFLVLFLFMLGTLLSGNRVPLVMFFLMLTLIFVFERSLRKPLFLAFIISFFSIFYLMKTNENFNVHLKQLVKGGNEIVSYFEKKVSSKELTKHANNYVKEFETGFLTWGKNKYFGGGIKSFYFNCKTIKNPIMDRHGGTNCNTHPHNYFLEIGAILGLLGFFLIMLIIFSISYYFIKALFFSKVPSNQSGLLIAFFIIFITEIFPLKTTGSFFSSSNSTFIFFIIGYIIGLLNLERKSNIEK
jgi:O-antigen ligase